MSEEKNTTNKVEAVSADTPENQERTPRETESREATQHPQSWENSANLPTPDPQTGWVFRYIRTSLVGNSDNPNVSRRFREGWQPCRLEDHPELQIHMMDNYYAKCLQIEPQRETSTSMNLLNHKWIL